MNFILGGYTIPRELHDSGSHEKNPPNSHQGTEDSWQPLALDDHRSVSGRVHVDELPCEDFPDILSLIDGQPPTGCASSCLQVDTLNPPSTENVLRVSGVTVFIGGSLIQGGHSSMEGIEIVQALPPVSTTNLVQCTVPLKEKEMAVTTLNQIQVSLGDQVPQVNMERPLTMKHRKGSSGSSTSELALVPTKANHPQDDLSPPPEKRLKKQGCSRRKHTCRG